MSSPWSTLSKKRQKNHIAEEGLVEQLASTPLDWTAGFSAQHPLTHADNST